MGTGGGLWVLAHRRQIDEAPPVARHPMARLSNLSINTFELPGTGQMQIPFRMDPLPKLAFRPQPLAAFGLERVGRIGWSLAEKKAHGSRGDEEAWERGSREGLEEGSGV